MAIDRREDAGEFYPGGRAIAVRREPSAVAPLSSSSQPGADAGDYYPGGKIISTLPVATDGDVKHSDFEDLDVKTNTLPDLRAAVKGLAARLGATVVTALAVCAAIGATVEKAKLNELDFDADPSVVTNVTFEGLAMSEDLVSVSNLVSGATVITQKEWKIQREYTRNVAVTNVQLMAGQIFAGLVLIETNLIAVVPVIGTTACVRVWAPYAEGYHTPNQFSAIEIGDGNQALCSQRIIAGQALYCPNPSMLRFTDGLDPADEEDTCTSLQDYLDVLVPDTIASLTAGLVPTTGDSVIDGSLTVNGSITANGQLISDGTIVITNADIIAKGFSVINRNLTADGMTISNGMCHIRCALLDLGLGTPRIHLENGTGASDFDGAALTNITFGGTWPAPTTNLRDYMHDLIERRIINELYSYEERIREIVREELGE